MNVCTISDTSTMTGQIPEPSADKSARLPSRIFGEDVKGDQVKGIKTGGSRKSHWVGLHIVPQVLRSMK